MPTEAETFDPRFLADVRARLRGPFQGPPYFCPWCGQVFVLNSGMWLTTADRTDCGSVECAHSGARRRRAYLQCMRALPSLGQVVGWLRELEDPDLAHLVSEALVGHPYYRLVTELLSEPHEPALPSPSSGAP
jgi:hypothetical protein